MTACACVPGVRVCDLHRSPSPRTISSPNLVAEVLALQDGWEFVMQQGAMLALMPIEQWLADFDRADSAGPILDPTLYREYLYSGKGELIRGVLRAALV